MYNLHVWSLEKNVLDTSIVVNHQIITELESKRFIHSEIIVPEAVVDELRAQASQKKEQGFEGLKTLKELRERSEEFKINLTFVGHRPSLDEIKLAGHGRIDAIIKDIAKESGSVLLTSDYAQYLVASAEGVESTFIKPIVSEDSLEFLKFFDESTMSVHLKENVVPLAKKGRPGNFILKQIGDTEITKDYLEFISKQILDISKLKIGSMEISRNGAQVIQYRDYRIAITKPPFSESIEITIVHPIVKLEMKDYQMSEELTKRFADRAEGILISGAPGSGKSTLASGLANFYHRQGKVVKTFESPRDLQVDSGVTQYTKLEGSFENSADILLLVRPDYTVFDEVRRKEDFRIFADLRLTGVGMIGVVHANAPLDAIQRFIGKIELGVIPSVIDTVVFVKDGKISKVYELEFKVKVPSGMIEQDLARPVIEIRNFEDHRLEYEIYTYGEENVVVPVSGSKEIHGLEKLAQEKIVDVFKRYDPHVRVEISSSDRVKVFVDRKNIPNIIGRGGTNISDLEKRLGIHIDVEEKTGSVESTGQEISFAFSESNSAFRFSVDRSFTGMYADILVNEKPLTSVRIGKRGEIRIPSRSEAGKKIMQQASSQNDIQIKLRDS